MQTHRDSFDPLFWILHSSVPPKPLSSNKEKGESWSRFLCLSMKSQSRAAGGGRRQWQFISESPWCGDGGEGAESAEDGCRLQMRSSDSLKGNVSDLQWNKRQSQGVLGSQKAGRWIAGQKQWWGNYYWGDSDKENWAEIKQERCFLMEHGHMLHL